MITKAVIKFIIAHWRTWVVLALIAATATWIIVLRAARDHYAARVVEVTKEKSEVQAAYDIFKADTRKLGEQQNTDTALKDTAHAAVLKKVEEQHAIDTGHLHDQLGRSFVQLRDAAGRVDPGSLKLPQASGTTVDNETVCFDSRKLRDGIRASLQRFNQRYGELVQRGAEGIEGFGACVALVDGSKP